MSSTRKPKQTAVVTKMKKVVKEINTVIQFEPLIDIDSDNLEDDLRANTAEIFADDQKELTKTTWSFLEKGGYLDHLKEKETPTGPAEDTNVQSKDDTTESDSEDSVVDIKVLVAVAEDLNTALGLTPAIDIEADLAELVQLLEENVKEVFIEDKEVLKTETWEFLETNKLIEHTVNKKSSTKSKSDSKAGATEQKPTKVRNVRVEALIDEGKHTGKEITAILLEEFPMFTKSSHSTVVSDSKNAKYNKFSRLTVMDPDTKILSFD